MYFQKYPGSGTGTGQEIPCAMLEGDQNVQVNDSGGAKFHQIPSPTRSYDLSLNRYRIDTEIGTSRI